MTYYDVAELASRKARDKNIPVTIMKRGEKYSIAKAEWVNMRMDDGWTIVGIINPPV